MDKGIRAGIVYLSLEYLKEIQQELGVIPEIFCINCASEIPFKLENALHLPEGFKIKCSGFEFMRNAIMVVVESDQLPVTQFGENLPMLEFTFWQNWKDGKRTTEVKEITLVENIVVEQHRTTILKIK